MKKSLKSFLSLFLVLAMVLCSYSFSVFAEGLDNEVKLENETVVETLVETETEIEAEIDEIEVDAVLLNEEEAEEEVVEELEDETKEEAKEEVEIEKEEVKSLELVEVEDEVLNAEGLRQKEFCSGRDYWYAGAEIDKEDIRTITFTKVAPSKYASSWEINGTDIMGYVTSENDVYVCPKNDVQIVAYPVKNQAFYQFAKLFEGFTSLEKIDNLGMVDASELVTMNSMFKDCKKLTEVDFEGFDTSQVEDFGQTFKNTGFEELDLSMLDTSKVSYYLDTFKGCENLRIVNINIASKNYSYNAIDIFADCPELVAVFVPDDFEGSHVSAPFIGFDDDSDCVSKLSSSLKKTYDAENDEITELSPKFEIATDDNSGVLTAQSYLPASLGIVLYDFNGQDVQFKNPKSIQHEKVYGRQFYLPIVEEMIFDEELEFLGWYRDKECTDGPIEKLSTDEKGSVTVYAKWPEPTIRWYTLDGGKELHLTMGKIPANAVTSGRDYFEERKKWENGAIDYDAIEKIIIDDKMQAFDKEDSYSPSFFGGFTNVKEIVGMSKIDFSQVKDFSGMFVNCEKLESIDISSMDTSNADSFELMFANTYALKSINFGNIDSRKVTNMSYMFASSGIENLDLTKLNTSNVTNMSFMFYECKELKNVNLSSFNTLKTTEFIAMFKDCTSLEKVDITSFALSYEEKDYNFAYMFAGCKDLVTIIANANFDIYKLKLKKIHYSTRFMFAECESLAGENGGVVDLKLSEEDLHDYADIAHLDGQDYDATTYGNTGKAGVFSTKDTTIVVYRSVGEIKKEDVRKGYARGSRITQYADLGAKAVYNKYYADEDKLQEMVYTDMYANVPKKMIYVEYIENVEAKPIANNTVVSRGGSSSSGSSSSSVGPLTNQVLVNEVLNQNPLTQEAQIAPNAVTTQENAKTASDISFNISNDEVTWEKNADGTWSMTVSVGDVNVTATNFFCTLTETDVVTGQQSNSVYYFDEKGQMATGWVKDNAGNMYFFETANTADVGKMTTGWKSVNGSYYYFGADGKMMSNGITPDGYYVGSNGVWVA